jgi:putative methanogen marker protein 4
LIDLVALLARGRRSELRVGIGLSEEAFETTLSRLRSSRCSVRLERYDDARGLMESLRSGDLDAAVRGTLSSSAALSELKRSFRVQEVMRAAVLDSGRPFVLAPVGIDEGTDAASRLRMAENALRYFGRVGWELRVGVLSKGRPEDSSRGAEIESSLRDGEMIASSLAGKGFEARHYSILVEDAVRDCDLILAPDGVSGNLMFRTLHFVGGSKAFGAPVVNIDRVFVDTSRAKEDYSDPVMLAAAVAEHGRARSEEA